MGGRAWAPVRLQLHRCPRAASSRLHAGRRPRTRTCRLRQSGLYAEGQTTDQTGGVMARRPHITLLT